MSVSVWLGMAEGFDWRRTSLFTAVGAVTMAALLACLALARRGQARARAGLDRDRFNPYEATVSRRTHDTQRTFYRLVNFHDAAPPYRVVVQRYRVNQLIPDTGVHFE